MEFSYQYSCNARRMAGATWLNGFRGSNFASVASAILQGTVTPNETCEVPSVMIDNLQNDLAAQNIQNTTTFTVPLYHSSVRIVNGADSILKHLSSGGYNRLNAIKTSKGETYYGNNGIILDKDFNILFLATRFICYHTNTRSMDISAPTIYLSPSVFTNTADTLCKALVKKFIPFLLTNSLHDYGGVIKAKIVLENPERFIYKIKKPTDKIPSQEDYCKVLKDNIDEVLIQLLKC